MSRELDDLEREFADLEQEAGSDLGPERRLSREGGGALRTLPIAVAVIALLAFGGIIWYAYNQGVRSGSEEAAPLLAPEGEAKVQPTDPGGMEIAHTDKEVFDRISGDEAPAGEVERILPPPEDPMQPPAPAPEPAPQSAAPADDGPTPPSITAPLSETQGAGVGEPAAPPPPDETLAQPLQEPPTAAPATDGAPTQPQQQPQQQAQTEPEPQAAPAPEPAPEPEPQPAPQPAQQPAQPAAADPTSGWQVQIAALRSEADAEAAWTRLQKAHAGELGDLSLSVQRAVVNGTTYFRVRGGPLASRDAASAVCNALKAKDQGCLVVRPGG